MAQTPLDEFIGKAGWGPAKREAITADWSVKEFTRLQNEGGQTAILMSWNGSADPIDNFIKVAAALRNRGLSAPEIYASDPESGYMLCEDFGDSDFAKAIEAGENPETLYALAVDILEHAYLSFQSNELDLPAYHGGRLHCGKDLIISHYFNAPADQVKAYNALWDDFEKNHPPCPQTLVHGDYHLLNLMWLPEREGLQKGGIIDFGSAFWGPLPYDLVNLLEDVRRDVPGDLKANMRAHYCANMNDDERSLFDLWYDVLAFQFHARVIGQIVKMDREDLNIHLPRLEWHIRSHLEKEMFKPFKDWFNAQGFSV